MVEALKIMLNNLRKSLGYNRTEVKQIRERFDKYIESNGRKDNAIMMLKLEIAELKKRLKGG
jgi:hypothetical protein